MAMVMALTVVTASVALAAPGVTNPDVAKAIADVRNATTKYHDVSTALADGYGPVTPFIPGQGIHYANFGLVDDVFDPNAPEVLQYVPTGNNGKMKLVSVEYLYTGASPPEGFPGSDDDWHFNPAVGAWALHTWTWLGNPDGLFAANNPKLLLP